MAASTRIGVRIRFDMARVGRVPCGTGTRLMGKRGEEAIGGVLRECVAMVNVWSASDRQYGEEERVCARRLRWRR